MSIEGRIAIDVSFADSATSDGVQSLKKISLADTTSYTTGKVAILAGTCGTAAVTVATLGEAVDFKDAIGSAAVFSSFTRLALSSPQAVLMTGTGKYENLAMASQGGNGAVGNMPPSVFSPSGSLAVQSFSGTASYTIVLYGT
jgi:hypothetical protein